MRRGNGRQERIFHLAALLLGLIIVFGFSVTVIAGNGGTAEELERFYEEQEKVYVQEIRTFLKEQGYQNCGVTLTRVTTEDGSRTYTVRMHHKYFDRLDEAGREELENALNAYAFEQEFCSFRYRYS